MRFLQQKPIDIFQMLTCSKEMTNSKLQYAEMISNKSEKYINKICAGKEYAL